MPLTPPERRIDSLEFIPVRVPRTGRFSLQRGTTPRDSPFTIVRIRTDSGVVGYGEGNTTVRGLNVLGRDNLAEALLGLDVFDLVGIHRTIDAIEMMRVERIGHWNVLRAAIDMALYDVQGKLLDLPVFDLLGGKQRELIGVIKNVGVGDVEASRQRARELREEGYRAVKIRVGADERTDLRRVEAVREAVGPDVLIRVDANQAWSPTSAIRILDRMAEFDLEAAEQPCPFWDLAAARLVVERSPVPIISDEGFWTVHEAYQNAKEGAADVLHVYLGKCGGIYPAMRIAAIAAAAGLAISPGERVPLGISLAAHCHYAAVLPELRHLCALAYDLNEHDLLTRPLVFRDGGFEVPGGPGLGVDVDEEKLRFYTAEHGVH